MVPTLLGSEAQESDFRRVVRWIPCTISMVKMSFSVVGMVVACLGMIISPLLAQKPDQEGVPERVPQSGPGGGSRSLMQNLPVLAALDTDGNGEISAAEITAASAALKTLDKNNDGKLSADELRPRFGNRPPTRDHGSPVPARPDRPSAPSDRNPLAVGKIGGLSPLEIVQMFGLRGIDGVSDRVMSGYRRIFGFTDVNKDGRHSRKEYVDGGRHLTPEARAGIFQASDTDRDGFVSEKEYVENRVITDQAKELFVSIDSDGDGRLTGGEIVGSRKVENAKLALVIFSALDTNGDEMLHLPEFLYTWGRWARSRKETKDRR